MTETGPTWENWGRIKPNDGLFYQDYKKRTEILEELLARSDAEVKRLRLKIDGREWLCKACNTIYPESALNTGPRSLICPGCGAPEIRPKELWRIVDLEGEIARLRAALDGVLEHCEICGAIATHATQWSDRDLVYFCDRPECVTKVNGWYDGDHEYDRVGMYTWSLGHEKARDALGGESSDLVAVPSDTLDWIFRSLCAYLDYFGVDSRCYDPKEAAEAIRPYTSLGNPSETPISSEDENESDL